MEKRSRSLPEYVRCIRNDGYPVSLEVGRTYQVVPDADATPEDEIRVIDESGEDYLYPADYFVTAGVSKVAEAPE